MRKTTLKSFNSLYPCQEQIFLSISIPWRILFVPESLSVSDFHIQFSIQPWWVEHRFWWLVRCCLFQKPWIIWGILFSSSRKSECVWLYFIFGFKRLFALMREAKILVRCGQMLFVQSISSHFVQSILFNPIRIWFSKKIRSDERSKDSSQMWSDVVCSIHFVSFCSVHLFNPIRFSNNFSLWWEKQRFWSDVVRCCLFNPASCFALTYLWLICPPQHTIQR